MKKLILVFTLISALFFAVSCDSGIKFENPNDQHNADASDSGNSEQSDNTDSDADVSDNDTSMVDDSDTTTEQPDNSDSDDDSDSDKPDSDNPDTTPDGGDTAPDNGDDDTEANDDTETENDADKDTSDSTDDTDSDNPDTSNSDNDTNTGLTDPCIPNPCIGIENSTEICTVFGNIHTCECKPNYYWDGSACGTTQTQTASCTGLPDSAEWNTVDTIIQTWDDYLGTWVPTNTGSYNENPSANQCRFKCKENYSWKNSKCVADTRTAECTALPENAEWWNSDLQITQTWGGTEWEPTDKATFCGTSHPNECCFKCTQEYEINYYLSECRQPPHYDPTTGLTWSKRMYMNKWSDIISYCDNLTEGGYSDWRLPTISELRTLIQNCSATETNGSCGVTDSCFTDSCRNKECLGCDYDESGKYNKLGNPLTLISSSYSQGCVGAIDFVYARFVCTSVTPNSQFRCVR